MKIIIFILMAAMLGSCTEKDMDARILSVPIKREKEVAVILSEAQTMIVDKGSARLDNINIACGEIDGTHLKSGEEFSFNKILGKRTEAKGYKVAPVMVDGEHSEGIGGGICQVSSTVYMAAAAAGLEITERTPHSKPVGYAPGGDDATVVYGVKDLKFLNSTMSEIVIYCNADENAVKVKITAVLKCY
ncbi:MAG: VanW family protein [Clostridia bacterium]|nr:VanW family protein [Clostridia bacterium]